MSPGLPKVSVNVVVYRQAEFIAATLDSILAQDYPNLEIIVTDDASPDATPQIITAYARKHKNIKPILSVKNGGITVNCNRGLAACTGDFICPFAGDDLMLPGKISKQVAVMLANPACAVCYHNMEWFESNTNATLRLHHQPGRSPQPVTSQAALFAENVIGGPTVMLRASAMPKGGYSAKFPFAGDWLLWLQTLEKGTLCYLDEVLVRYRRHSANETRVNPRAGAEQLAFMGHLEKTFPHAPAGALRHARALAWSAGAVSALAVGNPRGALHALFQTARFGRITPKILAAFVVALVSLPLPKAWRGRLWGVYAKRRFQ